MASVLLAFGLDDRALPDVHFPACVSAAAGALLVEDTRADVRIEGRGLLLTFPARMAPQIQDVWNEHGRLRLEDGSEISAKITNYSSDSMSVHVGELSHAETTFTLDVWSWVSARPAVAWVGHLHGLRLQPHNLGLWDRARKSFRSRGLRLRGNYIWYILGDGRDGDPLLIIDAGATTPDHELLRVDMQALEFTLGCPATLDLIVGVDAALETVAAMGPHFGFRKLHGEETWPPIPSGFHQKPWAAALFPKVSAKLREPEDRAFVAIVGYTDSLVDHLDGAYLKAQVALEAYCKSLGPVSRGRVIAQDAWLAWVASVDSSVRSLALNADAADALLGAMRSAMHGPTSGIVPDALAALGMRVPKDVLAEVRRRSVAVHEFVMARHDEDPIRESLPRVRMVQALLAAVAVKSIGYTGPVLGWRQDAEGQRDDLTWWDPVDDPEVGRFFVAERGEGASVSASPR